MGKVLSIAGFLMTLFIGSYVLASEFDPESSEFDPDKQFSITPYGAILGDPAQAYVVAKDRIAYSIVTVSPSQQGVMVMLSLVEPQQKGEPGGGHSLMMSLEESEHLISLLKESPYLNVKDLEAYGENHKLIGRVNDASAPMGEIAVLYKADDLEKKHVRIVNILGGTPVLFEFTPNAISKLVAQVTYFIKKAEEQADATKL